MDKQYHQLAAALASTFVSLLLFYIFINPSNNTEVATSPIEVIEIKN